MKKAQDVILECLKEKGMTQRELGRRMGEDVRRINQQIKRQKDIKADRFADVLEYIGYHLEAVDDEVFSKVTEDVARSLEVGKKPKGLFYAKTDNGYMVVDNTKDVLQMEEFDDYACCQKWLLEQAEANVE